MPTTIATAVSAFAANAAAGAGLSISTTAAISTATFYATSALVTLGINAGLAALAAQTLPSPETGKISRRQPVPARVYGYGIARLSGPSLFWEAKGNWTTNVIALHDGKVNSFGQVWLNDDKVELDVDGFVVPPGNGRYPTGFVQISTRQGLFTETSHDIVAAKFPQWTTDHRADGIATLAMVAGRGRKEQFQERYPNGEPEPSVETEMSLVYDPRDEDQDPGDPDTWLWSDNAILALLNFEMFRQRRCYQDAFDVDDRLIQEFAPARWARVFEPTIDLWIAAADVCDEAVALAAGGTVKRYTVGGFTDESVSADTTRSTLLTSCDGWLGYTGQGALAVYAGKYYAPTVTITDDDILDLAVDQGVPDEQSCNVLAVTFTDPTTDYTTSEPASWRDYDNIELRNGKERTQPLALPWVQNASQARRLAKRKMKRINAPATGMKRLNMTDAAFNALGQRYIRIQTSDSAKLADAVVEITGGGINLTDMSISYTFVVVDDTIDDWDAATEEGDATGSDRPDAVGVGVPANLEADVQVDSLGSSNAPRLKIRFDDPGRTDLTYVVHWKLSADAAYQYEYVDAATDLGSQYELLTGFVPAGSLDYSVAFIGSGQGDFAADETIDTTLAGSPPSAPSGLYAVDNGTTPDGALFGWNNASGATQAVVYVGGPADDFVDAYTDSGNLSATSGTAQTYNFPLSAGSYRGWVTNKNADGESDPAGPVAFTVV